MKTLLLSAALLVSALSPLRAAENDREVEARKVALELAGAFSNDGFMIRDGHWSGEIGRSARPFIAVNLYAGNQYWFSVGSEKTKSFGVRLYDEAGKPVVTEDFKDERRAAAGFAPTMSGQYYIGIDPAEGSEEGTFCLVYSYR